MAGQRKTGEALTNAIFQATWDELNDFGIIGLKIDSIAARCKTSKAVLYHHFHTKENLTIEAIKWKLPKETSYPLPNSGSLRGDVLEYMKIMAKHINYVESQISLIFVTMHNEELVKGLPYVDFNGLNSEDALQEILVNAHRRGEIKTCCINSTVVLLPLFILRYNSLIGNDQDMDKRITETVDEMYLPLIEFHGNGA